MAEKPLIYAVDDEEGIRELYACALESAGFEVNCFGDGTSLLEAMEGRVPDLILLDIMLDGMDGYEILRGIRHNGKYASIPVIMVSAKGEEISTHQSGGDAFVTCLDGVGRITIDGKDSILQEGESIVMPAGHPHAVFGEEQFKMLLVVVF